MPARRKTSTWLNSGASVDPFLSVEGQKVGILGPDHLRREAGGRQPPLGSFNAS